MVRRKIKIKRIENATARHVTFSKRRCGLMKKAHDLSVLCDAEVAVIIFSSKGNLFQFASTSMQSMLERFRKAHRKSESVDNNSSLDDMESNRVAQFTEKLKTLQSNVIGEDLEHLCLREVILLEQQIHESLGHIRARKEELILDELEELKKKVAETQRTTTVNASTLSKLINLCSPLLAGCGKFGDRGKCNDVSTLDAYGSLAAGVGTSNQSNCKHDFLPPAKHLRVIEDLNWSPASAE